MNKYIVKVAAQYVAQVHIYTASRQTKPNQTELRPNKPELSKLIQIRKKIMNLLKFNNINAFFLILC